MIRLKIGLLFLMLINLMGIHPALALEFEQKGSVVFVSGDSIDFVDYGRLEKVLSNGATTIVFSKIGGSRIDLLSRIGRLIQKSNVTTVATDPCGASCAYLFMAGKQRQYGVLPGKVADTPIFMVLAGARIEGSETDARSTDTYAYFKDAFGERMPRDLLNRYTTDGKAGQLLVFTRPSEGFPEGEIGECVLKERNTKIECKPVEGLTPVLVGALTTSEIRDLSGGQ